MRNNKTIFDNNLEKLGGTHLQHYLDRVANLPHNLNGTSPNYQQAMQNNILRKYLLSVNAHFSRNFSRSFLMIKFLPAIVQ